MTNAFWIWVVCAVLLVFFGVTYLTMSESTIRAAAGDNADSLKTLVRGWGAISVVVGAAIAFMARPVRDGDTRFRRALVVLSVVFAVFQLAAITVRLLPYVLLFVSILLLVAAAMVYRPAAVEWYSS